MCNIYKDVFGNLICGKSTDYIFFCLVKEYK